VKNPEFFKKWKELLEMKIILLEFKKGETGRQLQKY